ncbi:hypothetical protein [Streptomyces antioxidans]|nr:hypothetical protein [Streptomyces antioxidans]
MDTDPRPSGHRSQRGRISAICWGRLGAVRRVSPGRRPWACGIAPGVVGW